MTWVTVRVWAYARTDASYSISAYVSAIMHLYLSCGLGAFNK